MGRNFRWVVVIAGICGLVLVGLLLLAGRSGWHAGQADAGDSPPLMNKPLPEANLVDSAGVRLADPALRKGKVLLIFVAPKCPACDTESLFLKSVIDKRNDVSFYGVVSFGVTESGIKSIEAAFPFKVYFDKEPRLAGALGLYRVPIKLFVEDGIIRKSWKGATTEEGSKAEFIRWLNDLN